MRHLEYGNRIKVLGQICLHWDSLWAHGLSLSSPGVKVRLNIEKLGNGVRKTSGTCFFVGGSLVSSMSSSAMLRVGGLLSMSGYSSSVCRLAILIINNSYSLDLVR